MIIQRHSSARVDRPPLAACAVLAAVLFGMLMLVGCQAARPAQDPFNRPTPAAGAVAPQVPVVTSRVDVVKLRPGLVVNVTVLVAGKKEFEETAKRVTDEGTLSLPLLGRMDVKDLSLEALITRLTGQYQKYYVNPQVIVEFVRDTGTEGISPWGYVTVLGRVKNPGRIALPATRDMTVSGSIQKAGGFNTSAKTSAILVTRKGADGRPFSREIDLDAVGADGRTEEDVVVEAGDVVFVPELRF